jgi:ATP-dependent RNA helicase DeaD
VLTRILEAEPFDGIIVFVRTKTATVELAEKLEARGYAATALNGDIPQKQREQTVNRLKKGKLDILVATDVAARGLDVDRISHVINYDVPHDTESYVHRIGRTGRAGRTGDAILFVAPREKRMLGAIERATRQKIELLEMPTTEAINDKRIAGFKQRITDTLAEENMELFGQIIEQYTQEHNVPALEVAAALARLVQGDTPLLVKHSPKFTTPESGRESGRSRGVGREERSSRRQETRSAKRSPGHADDQPKPERGMERYRLEVGEAHGVKAGNIVGAIANEIGIDSEFINRVNIQDDFSTVDLPEDMPKAIFTAFKQIRISGQKINASKMTAPESSGGAEARHRPMGRRGGKPGRKPHDHKPRFGKGKKRT